MQSCYIVLVFLVYVFICFRSMNEDLSACWTRFCLEEFPVRRFLCELFLVECFVHVILAAVYWYLPAYRVLLIPLIFCSMFMSMILQKCYLFCLKILIAFCLRLSCFIFMLLFFSFPITGNIVLTLPDYKTKPVQDLFNASLTVQQLKLTTRNR